MTIHEYIREARKLHYKSAKQCWQKIKAPFSYEYYSNIERGTKFPNIEAVVFLCDALKLNKKKACFLWAMESMPDTETRNYFQWHEELAAGQLPMGPQVSFEDTFLVNERHRKLLESNPIYWEILSFFAMHEDSYFQISELISKIDMPKKELIDALDKLVKHDLLLYKRKKYAHPATYMHIPNTPRFHKLRNNNFEYTSKQLLHTLDAESITKGLSFRTTANKKLIPSHVERIMRDIGLLYGDFVNLQSPLKKDEGLPYTLCLMFAPRDFGNRR